ncbi:hypothetical protein EVAR_43222_1 [Eumeta japonica]|uniref:Uncharacterized protein n=1 Tax=Eumeta variegata TaxID=151549 RepID=A0A4C1WVQ5_EUMVA|nr:hypothetical protein EVAR_43222_1 [Eumeta japonica]
MKSSPRLKQRAIKAITSVTVNGPPRAARVCVRTPRSRPSAAVALRRPNKVFAVDTSTPLPRRPPPAAPGAGPRPTLRPPAQRLMKTNAMTCSRLYLHMFG